MFVAETFTQYVESNGQYSCCAAACFYYDISSAPAKGPAKGIKFDLYLIG